MSQPYPPGTPCWYDMTVAEPTAAKEFYTSIFGWEFEQSPWHYDKALLGGQAVAALGTGQPEGRSAWTTYLASDDVDACATAVVAAGGSVVSEPHDAPTGRLAMVSDPTGGIFGLWQGRTFFGSEVVDAPGAPCWVEASSRNPAATAEFLGTVFKLTVRQPYRGYSYRQLLRDGVEVAGVLGSTHERRPYKGHAAWLVYFRVADTDATVRAALERGATLKEKVHNTGFGRFAVVADPNGARFALMARPTG
jgi:predicted enzyme related to lactoylglutathione lyase